MRIEPQNGWVFIPGGRGWQEAGDTGAFYPQDLPQDWRLTFYANHYATVLVPESHWRQVPQAELKQWRDDTDPHFRFALELSQPVWAQPEVASRLQCLGDRISLLLVDAPAAAGSAAAPWPLVHRGAPGPAPFCWTPTAQGGVPSTRPAAVLLCGPEAAQVTATARALQAWRAGPPVPVFVDGSFVALEQLRVALELLDGVG